MLRQSSDFEPLAKVTGIKGRSNSLLFQGTEGWIWCDRGKVLASSATILESGPDLEGGLDRDRHKANFIDLITSGVPAYAPPEVGHRSATVCHLGLISILLKAHLEWNPDTELFEGDKSDLANRYIWKPAAATGMSKLRRARDMAGRPGAGSFRNGDLAGRKDAKKKGAYLHEVVGLPAPHHQSLRQGIERGEKPSCPIL